MADAKRHISLVFIGHYDSGKSTTAGHLLYKCGVINSETMEDTEKLATSEGKAERKFAWLMDELPSEREGGYSIDITRRQCETAQYKVTIVDAPGHVDFLRNTITGIAQADVAILVVDAVSFEENMDKDGQAKEHLLLAYTLGIKQVIVIINKMDDPAISYAEERFKTIREEVSEYLRKVGYKPMKVPFLPLSGLYGDNITETSTNFPWYSGPTFLEAINNVAPPKRPMDKPLRIPVHEVKYNEEEKTLVANGRVETGVAKPGMRVKLAPSGVLAEVRSLEMHQEQLQEASPGDSIGLKLVGTPDLTAASLDRGDVVSDADNSPASGVSCFQAQVIVMNHPDQITEGYSPVIDIHQAHVACKFVKIHQKLDRRTGKVLELNPPSIKTGEACLVDLEPIKSLCVEAFSEYPSLGRFVIRDMQQTVAVGVIKSIVSRD